MKTNRNKALYILRECLVVGLIFAVIYLASKPVNSWLGQRAIDNTGLDYLSYTEAVSQSQVSAKPILLKFSAIWCSNCRKMNTQVFSDDSVKEKINNDYLIAIVDYDSEEGQALFRKYGVNGFPVVVKVDNRKGGPKRLNTTFDAEEFLQQI